MSTSDDPRRKITSGGASKPLKRCLGVTRKGLEQYPPHPKDLQEYLDPQELKYIKHEPRSGLQEVTQVSREHSTICTRDILYAPYFEAVDAWREKRGLKRSLPLDPEVKSDGLENENVEDNEHMRASMAERFRMFDGLEDTEVHSPPVVTEGNVAVPSLDGGKITSELEKHEASGSK